MRVTSSEGILLRRTVYLGVSSFTLWGRNGLDGVSKTYQSLHSRVCWLRLGKSNANNNTNFSARLAA